MELPNQLLIIMFGFVPSIEWIYFHRPLVTELPTLGPKKSTPPTGDSG